jgi:UDP-N-acetylmuramyl tripeptide synthase
VIILSIHALRGPNFWSHEVMNLIEVRLNLRPESEIEISELGKRLESLTDILSLAENVAKESSLFLAKCIGKVAIHLHQNAGFSVSYIDTKPTTEMGVVNLVFEYTAEKAGIKIAHKSLNIIQSLLLGEKPSIPSHHDLKEWIEAELPDTNTQAWMQKAKSLRLPFFKADSEWPLQLGWGINSIIVNPNQELPDLESLIQTQELRIPLIAVTGSNGKTTTTRLIAHILSQTGYATGFTTSDGIYVNHEMIDKGDTTGPVSAEIVLRNKTVNFAVLETARGGIVRAGLGFDQCDIAVITNVQDDHLGISDIDTMEDLARVKGVVLQSAKPDGWVVVNADNPYTVNLSELLNSKIACFSSRQSQSAIHVVIPKAQIATFIEHGNLMYQMGTEKFSLCHLSEIPITFKGTLGFMVENALAAVTACLVYGISADTIAKALRTFYPSPEQTPGRMNIFELGSHRVLVDFAHNPDGFRGVRDFLFGITASTKIGIIVGTGDRKTEDLIMLGKLSAEMFDHVIIQQVKFLRGRKAEEIVDYLVQGIQSVDKNVTWERVEDTVEPLQYALKSAIEGSFITALSDVLNNPLELVEQYKHQLS